MLGFRLNLGLQLHVELLHDGALVADLLALVVGEVGSFGHD